jgi:hypothetical protein
MKARKVSVKERNDDVITTIQVLLCVIAQRSPGSRVQSSCTTIAAVPVSPEDSGLGFGRGLGRGVGVGPDPTSGGPRRGRGTTAVCVRALTIGVGAAGEASNMHDKVISLSCLRD